ncbi:MAG: PspC domain-containing protein [Saprospiraceae bacterium]|nr:PspC domain-containing protein [Saprospiraceae bacterium]
MKKIININLGGYPFTIDVDAYEKMESYFGSLERYFKEYENPHEIIFDIEVRMAELFKENIGISAIVSIKDIDEVIKILGTPEDISKDNLETEDFNFEKSGSGSQNFRGKNEYKVGKKLYRNPEDKVVSGVCSGLSSYFGIQDPIWIRLFFVLLTLSGMSVILYLVLMVLMPKAKTEADFKAMRGEPIDINTIARSLDEEINNISHQIQDFASTFKNRRKK